jgi:hypothetical protein
VTPRFRICVNCLELYVQQVSNIGIPATIESQSLF